MVKKLEKVWLELEIDEELVKALKSLAIRKNIKLNALIKEILLKQVRL